VRCRGWCGAQIHGLLALLLLLLLLLLQGVPNHPTPSRLWEIVEQHKVTQFYTAPTALRSLMRFGDEHVLGSDLSSLRVLGSVGEPINPEAWRWYHTVVGKGRCPIVDTWWQTETGGILITPQAQTVWDLKPGAATMPFYGVQPALLDPQTGSEVGGNGVSGHLCVSKPWPGIMRTLWNDQARFEEVCQCSTNSQLPSPGVARGGSGC
jgi:acetyl-CoA synthetase